MAQSVSDYYSTNFTECANEKSFLSSWKGLAYPSHTIGALAMPLQVFTAFCIVTKSSKRMNSVKWFLLNSHLWISSFDVIFCVLSTPYYFFPSMSGFTVGVFHLLRVPPKWQFIVGLLIFFGSLTSALMLFENRSSSIRENPLKIRGTLLKIVIYTSNFLLDVLIFFPFIIFAPEQETAKLVTLKTLPCPTEEFFTEPTFVLTETPEGMVEVLRAGGVIFGVFFVQLFFHSFSCVYFLYISPSGSVSALTRRIQRQFFIGILFQALVPTFFLSAPISLAIVAYQTGVLNQELINLTVSVFCAHGFAESLTIVCSHNSYRIYVKKLWKRNVVGSTFYTPTGITTRAKPTEQSN